MSCDKVQEQIASILDRRCPEGEMEVALAHIRSCAQCGYKLESLESLRRDLRAMNRVAVPADLTLQLRVIASHELQRQAFRRSISAFLQERRARIRLAFDNLMRPVAVPVAGGSLSAMVLFALLVPVLSFPHTFGRELSTIADGTMVMESPAGPYMANSVLGAPRIQQLNSDSPRDANVVELTIDERGRVSDFSIEHGRLTPDLQNIIMFSKFTPATILGMPTSSKVKAIQEMPVRRIRVFSQPLLVVAL